MTTFLKLHHGFLEHEKHVELSNAALLLHISGLMFASERLTDGRLMKARRLAWSMRLVDENENIDALTDELITAGVWEDWPKHFLIVNYEKYNNTKAQVDHSRSLKSERNKRYLEKKNGPTETDTRQRQQGCADDATKDAAQDASSVDAVAALRSIRGGAA